MVSFLAGLSLAMGGGLGQATFGVPMKYVKDWKWENSWGIFSLWAFFILPWILVFICVPDFVGVYANTAISTLLVIFLFGFFWGFGATTFGVSMDLVGFSLAYGVILGMTTAIGSLLPLLMKTVSMSQAAASITVLAVVICIIGVVIISYAGSLKDKQQSKGQNASRSSKKPWKVGLAVCLFSGVMSSTLNLGFVYGKPLINWAANAGASSYASSLPVWAIGLSGGLIANLLYVGFLMSKNKSFNLYSKGSKKNWLYTFFMGVLWFGGLAVYGFGAQGPMGASIGWPIMMCSTIIVANVSGYLMGEWEGAKGKPLQVMCVALGFLIVSICLLGYAATL